MVYGYARVSTKTQNEDRQLIALKEFGVDEKNIFIDKQSGKDFNRTNYRRLVRRIRPGDVFVVESIDRLGRDYEEMLEEWRKINKEKRCDIVVLDMELLDTRKTKDLTGTFISDLVLQLLSYVAQSERDSIKKRQAEGIAAAKRKGIKFGRPRKQKPDNFLTAKIRYLRHEINSREGAKECSVSHRTFLNWIKEND